MYNKQKENNMKKTNKLLLELEKELHELHECINRDQINIIVVLGKIQYINSIGEAIKVKLQMKIEKEKSKHGGRI